MASLYFGGSFNPIHHGHLICSRSAAEAIGAENVVLIPSAQPPHKANAASMASSNDRLKMCQLATINDPSFKVDSVELERAGPSYTFDTARILRQADGEKIRWLIGADMLLDLPNWHRAEELLDEIDFVVMARPGWNMDWNLIPPQFKRLRDNLVVAPAIGITSTEIRLRVSNGRSIRYLTPPAVRRYIHQHRLYQSTTAS